MRLSKYSSEGGNLSPSIQRLLTEILASSGANSNTVEFDNCDFEILTFQLGENIIRSNGSEATAAPDSLYLVGEGRVRLLSYSERLDQDVTLAVLNVGKWFGADRLLSPHGCFPYRAVAASEVKVYRLPYEQLIVWSEEFPGLLSYLSQATCRYQRVAFFRTVSSIQGLAGAKVRAIATKSVEKVIPAQTSITQFCQKHEGIFWLRSGSLQSPESTVPNIGEGWTGGHAIPEDWCSAQEVVTVFLPASADDHQDYQQLVNTLTLPPLQYTTASDNAEVRSPLQLRDLSGPSQHALSSKPAPHNPSRTTTNAAFPTPLTRQILDRLRHYPWVEQQSSSDCGAACLAMVSRYWNKVLPLNWLREQANIGRSGASLKSLSKAAEKIGFHARPVRASVDRIVEQTNPWIAHWQGNHYVVVYKISQRKAIIADPALGKRIISRNEFVTHWTGYGLLLEPTERLKETEVKQASLGRYLQLLIPYRSLVFQIIFISLLIQIFSLVTPLFTQIILDKVVVQKSLSTLNVFAIGLLMFSVWSIAMTTVRSYLLAHFSMRLDLTMVSGFIKHAISLPLKFYESRRVGDIITRVQENQKIQRFLIGQVMLAWLGFLTGFVYLGLMLYYNWQLTLMVMALIPPIIVITLVSTPFLRRISREVFKEAANHNSTLVEMMNGISAVKSAGVEQEVRWRWEDTLIQLKNASFRGQKFGIGLGAINGAVNTLGSTALLWLGASMVIQNKLTIGQFVAFNMMIGYVLNPVVMLANLWDELQEIFISVERLNDVFETTPEEPPNQMMLVLPSIRGEVLFENVTFRYDADGDRNTLENLSFQVNPGQTIAIVGRSGSGKTTLIKLLEGLYYPDQGRIFIDGHDTRHISPHSLRTQLGVVPQECFLFSGTILDNITLYRQDFSLDQVIEAAKLAEAHAFIQALPLGYYTKVGERGSTLSGGQRQRIAIARALLGDPRILILDEATSSLDTESERRFQQNLSQISRDRTTFIIAHRLSTVRNADRILVLDRGVLVEQGNHEELITQKELYFTLAQQQLDL